jgi:hypothetical protein
MSDDARELPTVSLDLRVPTEGSTVVKVNNEVLHAVQHIKVEMDAEKCVPMVSITFAAKHVQVGLPKAQILQERPVITLPVFSKKPEGQ